MIFPSFLFVVLILSPFLDETLMPGSSTNYARRANWFSSNGARFFLLVFLFLILSCPKRALVGGIVMRGCASSLLGSYIHQESILNNVNDTNVYSCV